MRNSRGFSLLELLVAISVFFIVTAIALPSLGKIQAQMQMTQDARKIALQLAEIRAEAIRMRTSALITFETTGFTWDYASIEGDTDGTCLFGSKSSWLGAVPADFEFNGFGLIPELAGPLTLTLKNGDNSTSIVVNVNGAIST